MSKKEYLARYYLERKAVMKAQNKAYAELKQQSNDCSSLRLNGRDAF